MMKDFKWKWQDTLIVIFGMLALGYALANYSRLPDLLPAQFSITGEVNRYWPKSSIIIQGAFLGLILPLAMQFIRRADPKKDNYRKFEAAYKMIRLAIAVMMDAMLVLAVAKGLNPDFAAGKLAIAVIGVLFIALGNYMPQIKDNYFTGIKTPWTLASPEVWRKTHRFSGYMWVASGVLLMLAAFLPATLSISLIITALLIAVIVPYVYSWLISQRMKA
ncbi:SdpI family protein [Paenibacillus sp. FSL R7-0331]|uniref:SdpI family protein n=1 Tax=Paenibacillus sp. FSL R7-0331 TaxID=1536773 RepID=UPI0005AA7059|nr:SdpI family protein [Paenibacillus sp. FSL R7-0331]